MKKIILLYVIAFTLSACEGEKGVLPDGFELVGRDGRTHFAFLSEEHLGDRIFQREAGRVVCGEIFQHQDYCEVLMWSDKKDIPKSLPVINRTKVIGVFEMKDNEVQLKALRN